MALAKLERQKKIVSLLNKTGFMRTNELAEQIGVTPMTIRRDINELAGQKQLIKDYGGARPINRGINVEFSTQEKINVNVPLKKNIGEKLGQLLPDECTIFLGAGTTLLHSLPFLTQKNITFVTNSFPAFSALASSDCRVISTGGLLHKNTGEFLGQIAERTFEGLNLDFALCSTNGIYDNSVTTSSENEGHIQNVAIAHSRNSIIVADHTKLDRSDIITFRELKSFDMLVTDDEIPLSVKKRYGKYTKVE